MYKASLLEYSLLTFDTYNKKSTYHAKLNGWLLSKSVKPYAPVFENDMFARCYIHMTGTKPDAAIIAYRGTLLTDRANISDDLEIYHHTIPEHETLAKMYYAAMYHYLVSKHGIIPSLTGHSLGGAYAQIVAIENNPHPLTVVFNSPGVGDLKNVPHLTDYSFIHNYAAKDGVINKDGQTVGQLTTLDIHKGDWEINLLGDTQHQSVETDIHNFNHAQLALEAMAAYGVYEQHAMANIIHYLKQHSAMAATHFG